jgi:hypothetical protein
VWSLCGSISDAILAFVDFLIGKLLWCLTTDRRRVQFREPSRSNVVLTANREGLGCIAGKRCDRNMGRALFTAADIAISFIAAMVMFATERKPGGSLSTVAALQ